STAGGSPPRWSWMTSAQAEPESSSRVVPNRNTSAPSSCQPEAERREPSSNTPGTPTTGVGWMAEPCVPGSRVEMYRETLPPVTGMPRVRQALDRPDRLPHGARVLGGAEVQAVGDRQRHRAGGGDIAVGLRERQLGTRA